MPRRRSAFTLVEMVVTIAIMVVLMGGLTSAVLIASHTAPAQDSDYTRQLNAGRVVQGIVAELATALWVMERTPTAITFTVPDRNADGLPERIRYACTGDDLSQLQRTYNGSTATILAEVADLSFEYTSGSIDETLAGVATARGEVVISQFGGGDDISRVTVSPGTSWGQTVAPALPSKAVAWVPTRLVMPLRRNGLAISSANFGLSHCTAAGMPAALLTETLVGEVTLPSSFADIEVTFSDVPPLATSESLALTIETGPLSLEAALDTRLTWSGVTQRGGLLQGNLGGWHTLDDGAALLHQLYGTAYSADEDRSVSRTYLHEVALSARIGSDTRNTVRSAVYTRNVPEHLSGWWELDFTDDPRRDWNGDGTNDWVESQATFSIGSLISIGWSVDSVIETQPDNDFATLTTAEAVMQTTSTGDGAFIYLPSYIDGQFSAVSATLRGASDGSQTLVLETQTGASSWDTLYQHPNLPAEPLAIRLVVEPDTQSVNLWLAGRQIGSFQYDRFSTGSIVRSARIGDGGADAIFESVSIRVAE